ncbi:MAG: HAD family hydrolase [Halobacteriaceae archaeon]
MTGAPAGISFDLFGTLVAADRPDDPAAAVGAALAERGVPVPDDWRAAYRESHVEVPAGAELPLPDHVRAALASRGVPADRETAVAAVRAAFESEVRTRPDAARAVAAAAERGPVGVLSNCSVPGLAERALARSELDSRSLAVVTSVGCGWRKPDSRAFAAVADALGVPVEGLLHVGDDPATDGGADDAGANSLLVGEVPLAELPARLEAP